MIDFVGTYPSLTKAFRLPWQPCILHSPNRFINGDFFAFRGSQRTIWHQFIIVLGVQGRSN